MRNYNIAVLMTVHNRKDITLECLNKFFSCDKLNLNIDFFIVDDGSTDGTADAINVNYPEVFILKGTGNLFWNRGMHYCWTQALNEKYDFYLWLNDDTLLFPYALTDLINTYQNNYKKCIVVGSICSPSNLSRVTYGGRIGNRIISPDNLNSKIQTFNGNLVLIPKEVVNTIGIIDPYFRHSFGDIEYGMRATKHKINIYITHRFVGTCERHDFTMKCFNSKYKLVDRFKHFYSPLGLNPHEFFYLNRKYQGLFTAIKTYISTHIRVILPQLWKR